MMQNRARRKGFTLVELMVAIAIIGLLASVAVYGYVKIRAQVARKACFMNMRKIYEAAVWYLSEEEQADEENLTVSRLVKRGYLKARPRCKYHKGSKGFYAIEEKADGRIIIKCVNIGGPSHGTFTGADE